MKTVYEKSGKTFLTNAADEDSSVSWGVSTECFSSNTRADGTVKIRDCYKIVNLEFYVDDDAEYEQKIEKIDTLISELNTFKDSLIKGWNYKKETEVWQQQ